MKHTLFIFALITASIQTFAQSPRIKLNQITKDSVTGSVLISSLTDSGMVYSRDLFISYGVSDTVLILGGDTLAKTSGTISSVLSDGVTITGDGTTGNELTADTSVLATIRALSDSLVNYVSTTELSDSTSNIRTDIPLIISDSLLVYVSRTELSDSLALISSSVTADNVTITGDGTVGSPLKVDTTTVIATKQDLDLKQDQLNGTGFVKATGTTITYDNSTYLTTEVDGSVTNEIQDISTTGAAGNISISSGSELNLNVDDADASASNEGSLTVGTGTASTSVISSNTSGSTDVTLTAGTNVTLSETGNNITIAATGGGTTYNNISETADTVYISDYLDVDTSTLYVDANNNNVGIGTSTPSAELEVVGDMIVDDSTLYVNADSNRVGINNSAPIYPFVIGPNFEFSNGSEMTVNSDKSIVATYVSRNASFGHFYFGNDNSAATFFGFGHVNSNGALTTRFTFDNFDLSNNSSDFNIQSRIPGVGLNKTFEITKYGEMFVPYLDAAAGTYPVEFNTSTKELTYDNTSSIRFKDNIRPFTKGLNELLQLNPVSYEYKETGFTAHGFIAEQVLDSNLEEIVTFNNEGLVQGLRRKFFFPLIVQAIQEQQAIIESQATEIEQLKTLITELSNRLTILENN